MGREIQTYIILPSSEACQVFIRDNEDMAEYMYADGDVDMYCRDTGVLSDLSGPSCDPLTYVKARTSLSRIIVVTRNS